MENLFGERLISQFGWVNWRPRSFLWTIFCVGYVKPLVFSDKPVSIDALEVSNTRAIREKPSDMLERLVQNWTTNMNRSTELNA